MRLNKFLAGAGVASRRAADIIIQEGRIAVNGEIVQKLGTVVDENLDKVTLDGKPLELSTAFIYLMLNKPTGYIVTSKDERNRPIILDLMGKYKSLVKPVGRLDLDSSGLLILTNDGEFAFRLSHPRYEIEKTYLVKCEGLLTDGNKMTLEAGIELDDGPTAPAKIKLISRNDNYSRFEITIHEGRKRQVRRMCKEVDNDVLTLRRVSIGPLKLGDLEQGTFRRLKDDELTALKKAVKML